MVRRQIGQIVNETLNYFFNWNEFTIRQLILSVLLIGLFCRSIWKGLLNSVVDMGAACRDLIQKYRENRHENGLVLFGAFRHRDES
jgi:hypothetical protein